MRKFIYFALLALACNTSASHAQEVIQFSRQQLTDTYFSEGISVGDINADGQEDIVYGPYWFAGPDFSQSLEIYPAKPQPMQSYADNFFSWIYDFNQDGANDVFVVGFPGTPAFVYENGKAGNEWTKRQVFDWVSNESPQLINLTGDERPELVCTRDGFFGFATINWQQPFDPWTFHPISEKVTATKFGHGLGVGDVNSDGLLDIIHAGGWYEQPRENASTGRWREHKAKFSESYGGAEMFAYDVDGDGDSDVVTSEAAHDFGLAWYEQTGSEDGEPQFKRHLIMGQHPSENKYGKVFSELHSVRLADMDGDGLQDIVTGKTYYSHHQQSPMWDAGAVVVWFKLVRTDQGVDWLPYEINGKTGIGRQVTVADINGDGHLDVATGGMLGANVLLQERKDVTSAQFAAAQPQIYSGPKLPDFSNAQKLRGPRSPIGSDGLVPSAIEGETLKPSVTAGTAKPQPMGEFAADVWSGKSQLWWTGTKPGDKLSVELDALRDCEAMEMAMTCARDYAVVQLHIDGQALGEPIDLFDAQVVSTGLLEFKTALKKGKHQLEVEILGANRQAVKSYMFGLDYIRFRAPGQTFPQADHGLKPKDANGKTLNLDFENGTLDDWTPTGEAFAGQPIEGDVVAARRNDSRSRHVGNYWIGGYELHGDQPTGTLTSKPFLAAHRYATFFVGGGNSEKTRVELQAADADKPFFTITGRQVEDLGRVVVDLKQVQNREIFIRLVDEASGGWGHINFDHFRLHDESPGPITTPSVNLVADEYPHSGLDAEAAAAAMRVPEGFQVAVCAAEPDVKQPIAMAIDDRGRTWIAEAYEYPLRAKGDTGRDRILIFEDTTGDGKFDSRKVFYEGLNLISGLEVGFGGVWVGAAPNLLFIPDADGDDQPDAQPTILLDGWGYEDTHETLNTFQWGPDGWLYGCHGVFTHSNVGRPGATDAERTRINAGVWRYHPVRHEFEVFAHGTSNPWGVDFDQHGEAFVTACVIPHLYHIIPGARYQRQAGQHFNKYTYADIPTIADHLHYLGATPHSGNGKSDEAGGGHAHAGAMIYQGGAWPAAYQGMLFMNNIHGQRLNTDRLVPQGSGFVGQHGPDFLLTGDMASQILNMQIGPDGQVQFIDWYDMQACHRREVEVHDRSNGRIYKVSYGQPKAVQVDLAQLTDLQLVDECLNKNEWFVRHARRQLQERASQRKISQDAIARVMDIARTHPDATRRLRAIWARHAIGVFDPAFFAQLFNDTSPHVRGWALRLLIEQRKGELHPGEAERITTMAAKDTSPIVRLAIASALDKLPAADRWGPLSELVKHASDVQDHNLPLMYWYALEPLADVDADRMLALGLAAGENFPLLRDFTLRRIAGTGNADSLERLLTGLSKTNEPAIQSTFLSAIQASLRGQRQTAKPAQWDAIYARLSSSSNTDVRQQAVALGVTFGDERASAHMRQLMLDTALPEAQRVTALQSLLAAGDPQLAQSLIKLVNGINTNSPGQSQNPELIRAAITGMAQYDQAEIPATLVTAYSTLSPDLRRAAVATLSSRIANATQLLSAIEAGSIPAADLTADLARRIDYLGNPDLSKKLTEVWGQVNETSADKLKTIESMKELIARSDLADPDLSLGRTVFAKTCQRCHVLYGVGEKLGPDLTGSNRSNLDYLLENIVDPSSVMANEYRQSIFLTDSGQAITGIVRSENEQAVTIQTAEATIVLPKDEIEQRKASAQSMMPDNQLSQFTPHETRSLLAYLRGKQQVPLRATEENQSALFNGRDLTGWSGNLELWSVVDNEIVGKSTGLNKNEFLISDLLAGDFKLALEIKLVDNAGNSGVQFRSKRTGDSVEGYQADVGAGWWGKLYEEHGRGLLWEKSGEAHLKSGEWNRYEIEAIGSHVKTWLNGEQCVDLDDPPGARQGIFALQLHSGGPTEVRFRNLQLQVVKTPKE
ncbi:MAG: family 16 glycoside hydrolase [Pirellulaceae bacterium]